MTSCECILHNLFVECIAGYFKTNETCAQCTGNTIKATAGDATDCNADSPCDGVTQTPNEQHTACGEQYFFSFVLVCSHFLYLRGYTNVFYFIWGSNRLILTFVLCDPRIHLLYYSRGRLLIVIARKLSYGKVMCS